VQEEQLVAEPNRLLIAACVLNRWDIDEILNEFRLTKPECVRHLAALDRVKFVELLPNNRYRIKVSDRFGWLPDGPIERYFNRSVAKEFLSGDFRTQGSARVFLHGFLSDRGRQEVLEEIRRVSDVFRRQMVRDRLVPVASRRHVGAYIAFRPWAFSIFEHLRRKDAQE